jgi:hypothetical protein
MTMFLAIFVYEILNHRLTAFGAKQISVSMFVCRFAHSVLKTVVNIIIVLVVIA